MLDYKALKAWPFPVLEQAYTSDDAMFYALAVGLGADPVDERLATVTHTTFCRGDGGFSARDGAVDAASTPLRKVPERSADVVFDLRTLPQQALLYRRCADRNPLHSEPAVARAAGFARPILHGLAAYGVACHAMLATLCDYDPARLERLSVRFSSPVFPGETIRFEIYDEGTEFAFRARVVERDKVVLDHGCAAITVRER